jgi:hypothetical protein
MGATGKLMEPAIAFRVREHERPALEVRVNFGVLTGRQVTPPEIDDLARQLREIVPSFEIVSEERHEFGNGIEASVHQVVIESAGGGEDAAMRIVDTTERWARSCFEARHSELTEI